MTDEPTKILGALGKTVRELRLDHGLTQEELAEKAGIHPNYVSDIERGKRNIAIINLTHLANALEMTAAELLFTVGL